MARKRRWISGVGAAAIATGFGCGGGIDAPSRTAIGAAARYIEISADATCGQRQICCAEDGFSVDDSECRSRVRADLERFFASSLVDRTLRFDGEALARCEEQVAAVRSCGGLEAVDCSMILMGLQEEAESCTWDLECVDPELLQCVGGVCTRRAEPGEPCGSGFGVERADCRGSFRDVTCATRPRAVDDRICAVYVRAAEGQPCGQTCGGDFCRTILVFDPVAGELPRCHFEDGVYCTEEAVCARLRALGESCTLSEACGEGAWCREGVCVPFGGDGEPCEFLTCRPGLYCDEPPFDSPGAPYGVCRPPLPAGSPCRFDAMCAPSYCDHETGLCDGDAPSERFCRGPFL